MQNRDDAIQKAKHLAQTPEGQQLMEFLQKNAGNNLENALESAASGNFSQIQDILSQLVKNPEAQKLLKRMEW